MYSTSSHQQLDATSEKQRRIENALWGLFIADALAMPGHWFYDFDQFKAAFPEGITQYEAPPDHHQGAFFGETAFKPDVANAKKLGRKFDVVQPQHKRFYETSYEDEKSEEIKVKASEKPHYHLGLKKGANTTNAHLVRFLLRTVIAGVPASDGGSGSASAPAPQPGKYREKLFLEGFVDFATEHPREDPYLESYLRDWFVNYASGKPPAECAAEHNSMSGIARPLVLSLLTENPTHAMGLALAHQNLTHRSGTVAGNVALLTKLLNDLVHCRRGTGAEQQQALIEEAAKSLRLPTTDTATLFGWFKSGEFKNRALEVEHRYETEPGVGFAGNETDDDAIRRRIPTICNTEVGVPLLLLSLIRHPTSAKDAILSDVNLSGDNIHRGMVLGLLAGARQGAPIDAGLKEGLKDYAELKTEIEGFAAVAVRNDALW